MDTLEVVRSWLCAGGCAFVYCACGVLHMVCVLVCALQAILRRILKIAPFRTNWTLFTTSILGTSAMRISSCPSVFTNSFNSSNARLLFVFSPDDLLIWDLSGCKGTQNMWGTVNHSKQPKDHQIRPYFVFRFVEDWKLVEHHFDCHLNLFTANIVDFKCFHMKWSTNQVSVYLHCQTSLLCSPVFSLWVLWTLWEQSRRTITHETSKNCHTREHLRIPCIKLRLRVGVLWLRPWQPIMWLSTVHTFTHCLYAGILNS